MITGVVNSDLLPTVALVLFDATGNQHAVEATIDTGFNGELTLPAALVEKLGLTWQGCLGGFLADGSYVDLDVYAAQISWDGTPRLVDVQATSSTALLGTGLLRDYGLAVEFRRGGSVKLEALP